MRLSSVDRGIEFRYMKDFIKGACFDDEICQDQLRCLWTAYCLRYNLIVDTSGYDNDLLELWNVMQDEDNGGEPDTADWSDYDSFDIFMCKYLV